MENDDRHPVPDPVEDYRSEGHERPISEGDPDAHEGPANPSDEAEDRNKSPEGGRSFNDDDVAVDPEGAPTANGFMTLITVVMLVIVVLVVVTALTEATIMLIVTFLAILVGLGLVLKSLFEMMATD
ncbi:MAG: hypothetical protein WC558_16565 [Patulibacter sp.]